MSVETDLKKEGIEVVHTLDTLKVNSIAKDIAQKLTNGFPEHDFKLGELFIKLSRIKMYTAKVPNGFSEANYFYKNCSIYFNEKVPLAEIGNYAMHECIHYLQERKDKKGHLLRLGLCDLTQYKVHGLGMNEAAVQFATAKALNFEKDTVKYYGISFETISPNCYPIICNLIQQMAYITGEYILFDSTFNSNNNFKNKFIEATSEKVFYTLEDNFDKILQAEEELISLNNKLANSDRVDPNTNKKIAKAKDKITTLFTESQNLILSSYFDKSFVAIQNLEEVENYRRKLYNYKNLIGIVDGNNYFNSYYIDTMAKLEDKYNQIENGELDIIQDLTVIKESKFIKIIKFIKNLLFRSGEEYKKVDN